MSRFRNLVVAVMACVASSAAIAEDLAGFWQPEGQPAWVEIRFEEGRGTGTVLRNENKPEAVGRILLKDLVADDEKPASWRGQIYAERLKEYKDALITLTEAGQMQVKVKVGFMSRTVNWTRVAAVPQE